MGLSSRHVHGAMAKVAINGVVVGIWTTFSYSVAFDVVPSFILGRYTPAALTTTGVEPVAITAGGWRVVNHSFFKVGGIPDLKNLLFQEDLTLSVVSRVDPTVVLAEIKGCLPTGVSVNLSSKQLSDGTNTYLGMLANTEDHTGEEVGAVELP
jgi:hypothetical protein